MSAETRTRRNKFRNISINGQSNGGGRSFKYATNATDS